MSRQMTCNNFILWLALFLHSVLGTGVFTNPTGLDGQITYTIGEQVTITWTNTTDYAFISLGIFSFDNGTVSWLLEDSTARPTSYTWTVNADALGFNLEVAEDFRFYVVNGSSLLAPFASAAFDIRGRSSVATSTETETATMTSGVTETVTVTASATQGTSGGNDPFLDKASNRPSIGARIGFWLGLILGVSLLIGIAAFFYRRHYGKRSAATNAAVNAQTASVVQGPGSGPGQLQTTQQHALTEYYAVEMPKADPVHPVAARPGPSGQNQSSFR